MKSVFAFAAAVACCAIVGGVARAEEKKGAGTIVDVAIANGNFKTLVKALTAADLVETLKGPGPFTVFAPTDEAFAKIPEAKLKALLADKKMLTKVLTYHVMSGKVMAADAMKMDGKMADTVAKVKLPIMVSGDHVMVGGAKVMKADIKASNGVIHVIDTVLIPKE